MRLKTLSNGDIMGNGYYSENLQNIRLSPWLFRMSPEGELRWSRTYFDIDPATHISRRGTLFDFIELENGDILAVGYFNYANDDMLIMRVDANGCLDPEDCHEVNIIDIHTATKDQGPAEAPFTLYPNPASQTLYLDIPVGVPPVEYAITDMTGRRLLTGRVYPEAAAIDIASLPSGMYLIGVYGEGRMYGVKKFVVGR